MVAVGYGFIFQDFAQVLRGRKRQLGMADLAIGFVAVCMKNTPLDSPSFGVAAGFTIFWPILAFMSNRILADAKVESAADHSHSI